MPHSIRNVIRAAVLLPLTWVVVVLTSGIARAQDVDLFDPAVLHEIRIYIHPNDWRRLQATFQENTYYEADFQWRDKKLASVGIRSRGRGSRSSEKPGLRIDFNRFVSGQELLKLKSVILDNATQDPSFLRERLSMQLFARAGIPAPREAFCRLYINDKYWGLYSLVESIDKEFLDRTLNDSKGYLYEYSWISDYHFEDLGPDPNAYVPLPFKPQTHEDKPNPAALLAMIHFINHAPDDQFKEQIATYIDPRQLLAYLAVEVFLAEHDGFTGAVGMNNFYLYTMSGSTKNVFIPWDKDVPFWEFEHPVLFNFERNVLVRRLLAIPQWRDYYIETLLNIAVDSGGEENWMFLDAEFAYELIRQSAHEDPNKPQTAGEFEGEVEYVKNFVRARAEQVLRQIHELRTPLPVE